MQYFAHITNTYVPKNKLQKDFLSYIIGINNTLVNDVATFIKTIEAKAKELNKLNPRCTPLELSWFRAHGENVKVLHLAGNFSIPLILYKVLHVYPNF